MKDVMKFDDFKLNELVGFGGEVDSNTINDFEKELEKIEKEVKNLLDAGISKSSIKKKLLKMLK